MAGPVARIGEKAETSGPKGENRSDTHLAICLDKTRGKQHNSAGFNGQETLSGTRAKHGVTSHESRFWAQKEKSQRSESNRQPPVYKTGAQDGQVVGTPKVTELPQNRLATSLAFSLQEYPELDSMSVCDTSFERIECSGDIIS